MSWELQEFREEPHSEEQNGPNEQFQRKFTENIKQVSQEITLKYCI